MWNTTKTTKRLTPFLFASALAIALAASAALLTAAAPPAQRDSFSYSRESAEIVARKLYLAILAREPDGPGLTLAVAELQRGNLSKLIDSMAFSNEFNSRIASKPPAAILEQFYRGLFNRPPDSGGVRTYLARVEQRKYTDVMTILVESPEFDRGLPDYDERHRPVDRGRGGDVGRSGDVGRGGDFGRGGDRGGREDFGPPPVIGAALPCVDAVLEMMRRDNRGRVFARFDDPDLLLSRRGVDTISGTGVEVLGINRRFSYRCEVDRVTGVIDRPVLNYEGGRVSESARIPGVLECQTAVLERARRERGRRDLQFESGAIVPMGRGLEVVRGVAREDTHFGGAPLLEYGCELDRGRVTDTTVRFVR